MRPLCASAGKACTGFDRARGLHTRRCAKGVRGGMVSRQADCETCTQWAERSADEPAVVALNVIERKKANLAAHPAAQEEIRETLAAMRAPCLHRGDSTAPPDRLPTAKAYFRCEHPEKPLGEVVCTCKGCGPKCVGYEAEPPEGAP